MLVAGLCGYVQFPTVACGQAVSSEGRRVVKSNVRALDLDAVRARLAAFEERYAVPSDRLFEAFTVDGQFHETADFVEWSFLYGTLQDAAPRAFA